MTDVEKVVDIRDRVPLEVEGSGPGGPQWSIGCASYSISIRKRLLLKEFHIREKRYAGEKAEVMRREDRSRSPRDQSRNSWYSLPPKPNAKDR